MSTDVAIKCGDMWLDEIATVAGVEFTSAASYTSWWGDKTATWQWDASPNQSPDFTQRGTRVEVWAGAICQFAGILSEPTRGTPWNMVATGLGAEMARYIALELQEIGDPDSEGTLTIRVPSTNPDAAFDFAVERGLPLTRAGSLGSDDLDMSEVPDNGRGMTIEQLLLRAATVQGKYLKVSRFGTVSMAELPTVPGWLVDTSIAQMGIADPEYVTDLFGYYIFTGDYSRGVDEDGDGVGDLHLQIGYYNTVLSSDEKAARRWGKVEKLLDLSQLELGYQRIANMTPPPAYFEVYSHSVAEGNAQILTDGRFAQVGARMGYTNGIEVDATTLQHVSGVQACPPDIHGGDMFRMYGLLNMQGDLRQGLASDIVAGQVTYRQDSDSTSVDPIGLVPRDFDAALQAIQPGSSELAHLRL